MADAPTFLRSVFDLKDLPNDGLPEVALIGRSNVGKSSLINALANRKGLAKTSSTPGKTRCLNYYRFGGKFYLIDTPGYGYARLSKTEQAKWHSLMDSFFIDRAPLVGIGIVIDVRHQGLTNDLEAIDWMKHQPCKSFVILTKADKTSQKEVAAHEKYLRTEFSETDSMFSVSSQSGKGIIPLRRYVETLIGSC